MPRSHDSASNALAAASNPASSAAAGGADVLSDVLRSVRLTGALLFFVEASSPYLAEAPASELLAPIILPGAQHIVSYHLLMEGSCYCEIAGQPPLHLSAGDVVVIPHGDRYALSSSPGMFGAYPQELVLEWFEQMAARVLPDPVIGSALALVHQRPSERWTVEKLAQTAGVSRSGLAERFATLVGQPPMQYLTRWRLQLAAGLLATGRSKISAVALDVGYDSEAAFSRAFKALVGVSPAAWRQQRSPKA